MGWAWVLAAAVVGVTLRRRRSAAPVSLLVAAPAVFLALSLSCARSSAPAARFTLEGLAFPYTSRPEQAPALRLGQPASPRALTPSLALPGLPGGEAVEVRATPARDEKGAPRAARLDLRLSPGSRALIGLARRDDAFPFTNVVRLHGGETLVVCPQGRGECRERLLPVVRLPSGGLKIGPCDLSGEPRRTWRPSTWGRGPERTLAVLDLYHYETGRCVPQPVDESTPFWARRDGRGGWYLPLRSFVWLRGGEARLALLDPPETLELRGAQAEPAVEVVAEGPGPHRVQVLEARVDVPYDVPCQAEAQARGDLSGGALCKRLRVSFRLPSLDLFLTPERLVVVPPVPPAITVDAACDGRARCGLADLQAAYFKETELDVKPNVPLLWFGLTAAGGEPLAAHLRFDDDARACGRTPPPCLVVGTRDGSFVHPAAGRLALGSADGEQVYLRATLLALPWWLAGLLVGLLLVSAALWARLAEGALGRLTVATVAVAAVLLSARALFGFKLLARYPHDPEGLAGTLLGWIVLPTALACAARADDARGAWRAVVALLPGLALLAVLWRSDIVTLSSRLALSLALGLSALLVLSLSIARWGRAGWERLNARPEWRHWVTLLALVAVARLGLAVVGFERVFDVPLLALYWPASIVLLGLVLRRVDGAAPWPAWLPAGSVPALALTAVVAAQALGRGDTGAAFVLAPPLALAAAFVWGARTLPLGARPLRLAAAALVLAAAGGAYAYHAHLDRLYPAVAAERVWSARDEEHKGRGYLCPEDDETRLAALDLTPHAPVFDHGNLAVRGDDYLLDGAANRAGTRVGAEVHEFMAVLRRYAAGPTDDLAGAGYLGAEVRRYGAREVQAQLADGVPSLLVAAEGGSLAVLGLLGLHALLLHAFASRHAELAQVLRGPDRALAFIALACAGVPAWTTLLMVGGNFGLLPFTGQSTPLLVVFSGMDLVVVPALWVIALGATRLAEERAAAGGVVHGA